MWRIRLFEERVGRLKQADEVHGLIHLSVGQEGVAAAVCSQLRDDDAVYSGHRAHGHAIAKGAPLERMMAELMGRDTGLCRGLGGSMHLVDVEHGFMGATGVVGGNIPIALGSALAARLRGEDSVAVVFFGDGAVQAGPLQRDREPRGALEAAADPRLREQRLRGVHAALGAHRRRARERRRRALRHRARRPWTATTSLAVWEAFGRYLASARAGRGPFLLECLTHRLRGHYEGDPGKYREAIAAADWQEKDPILRLQRHGVAQGWFEPRTRCRPSRPRPPRRSRRPCASGARARSRRVGLIEEMVYADG